jgi:hypothetical protein
MTIDWANLTTEDKEVFFSWLDEFFARYFNLDQPPRAVTPSPVRGPPVRPFICRKTLLLSMYDSRNFLHGLGLNDFGLTKTLIDRWMTVTRIEPDFG